jgi:hypothetical protein
MLASSAERSTVLSQFAICSATSLPIPSTVRNSARFADRIRSGVLKTSSSLRRRTGPIFATMLSAMQASVLFIWRSRGEKIFR